MERSVAIANEFLARAGSAGLTQMQLQKLVCFAHGWTLALTGNPLTGDQPEAWDYGPVYKDLYDHTKFFGRAPIDRLITPDDDEAARFFISGRSFAPPYKAQVSPTELEIIDRVWRRYGTLSGAKLSALTHQAETPWALTYDEGRGKSHQIGNDIIKKHYEELVARAGPIAN